MDSVYLTWGDVKVSLKVMQDEDFYFGERYYGLTPEEIANKPDVEYVYKDALKKIDPEALADNEEEVRNLSDGK